MTIDLTPNSYCVENLEEGFYLDKTFNSIFYLKQENKKWFLNYWHGRKIEDTTSDITYAMKISPNSRLERLSMEKSFIESMLRNASLEVKERYKKEKNRVTKLT